MSQEKVLEMLHTCYLPIAEIAVHLEPLACNFLLQLAQRYDGMLLQQVAILDYTVV
jgi:hypothetical protein